MTDASELQLTIDELGTNLHRLQHRPSIKTVIKIPSQHVLHFLTKNAMAMHMYDSKLSDDEAETLLKDSIFPGVLAKVTSIGNSYRNSFSLSETETFLAENKVTEDDLKGADVHNVLAAMEAVLFNRMSQKMYKHGQFALIQNVNSFSLSDFKSIVIGARQPANTNYDPESKYIYFDAVIKGVSLAWVEHNQVSFHLHDDTYLTTHQSPSLIVQPRKFVKNEESFALMLHKDAQNPTDVMRVQHCGIFHTFSKCKVQIL